MNKKIKKAAALSYEQGEEAPKIIALGKGETALKIIETAKENDLPIFENSGLVETLLQMEIGRQIPPELYNVAAEILVYVSRIDKLKGDGNGL